MLHARNAVERERFPAKVAAEEAKRRTIQRRSRPVGPLVLVVMEQGSVPVPAVVGLEGSRVPEGVLATNKVPPTNPVDRTVQWHRFAPLWVRPVVRYVTCPFGLEP